LDGFGNEGQRLGGPGGVPLSPASAEQRLGEEQTDSMGQCLVAQLMPLTEIWLL